MDFNSGNAFDEKGHIGWFRGQQADRAESSRQRGQSVAGRRVSGVAGSGVSAMRRKSGGEEQAL